MKNHAFSGQGRFCLICGHRKANHPIVQESPNCPPLFASLSGVCLRLKGNEYYRDAGDWSVQYVIRGDKTFVKSASDSHLSHCDNQELVPCTEQEWKLDNGRWVSFYSAPRIIKYSKPIPEGVTNPYSDLPPVITKKDTSLREEMLLIVRDRLNQYKGNRALTVRSLQISERTLRNYLHDLKDAGLTFDESNFRRNL